MHRTSGFLLALLASSSLAGPAIQPGDLALRHDIQRLADYGVIKGTVTTWPLAWGPILAEVRRFEADGELPRDVTDALERIRARGAWETRTNSLRYRARVAAQEKSASIRSFQNTPREEAELSGGLSWTGDRWSVDLSGTVVSNPSDDEDVRFDGSEIGVAIGNVTVAASTLDRWWGPAWDNSLVLSSNARPIPALTIDRRFTRPIQVQMAELAGVLGHQFHLGAVGERTRGSQRAVSRLPFQLSAASVARDRHIADGTMVRR